MIILILVLRSLSFGAMGLVLPLYFDSIDRSAGEWGLASGAFAFATILAEPSWGWASDRLGATIPFVMAGLGPAILAPLFALTGGLGALLALQLARGSFEFALAPSARKVLAHSLGAGRKALGVGIFQASVSAGRGLGPLVGAWALGHWDYSGAFLASAAVSLLAAVLTLAHWARFGDPAAPARPPGAVQPASPLAGAAEEPDGPGRTFLAIALSAVCLFAAMGAGRAFVPLLGTSVLDLDASAVAAVLAVTGVLGGPLTIVTGNLADRWGRKPLILGGLFCAGSGLVGYACATGYASLAVSTLLLTVGFAAAVPAGVAFVSDVTPPSRQGRMIGLYGGCENIGIMAGPVLCGFVWDAQGPSLAFAATAVVTALGLVAAARVREEQVVQPNRSGPPAGGEFPGWPQSWRGLQAATSAPQ